MTLLEALATKRPFRRPGGYATLYTDPTKQMVGLWEVACTDWEILICDKHPDKIEGEAACVNVQCAQCLQEEPEEKVEGREILRFGETTYPIWRWDVTFTAEEVKQRLNIHSPREFLAKCTCGAASLDFNNHSTWCDLRSHE